jgi:hypothetical protein
VLLLNRALTTAPGKPAAHRGKGWEEVTEQAIRALVARGGPPSNPCKPERLWLERPSPQAPVPLLAEAGSRTAFTGDPG